MRPVQPPACINLPTDRRGTKHVVKPATINAEYHEMKGSGMVPPPDNREGARDKTRLLAVMAGFRF